MTEKVDKKEVNILATGQPRTIKLADGKEYKLPPIDMTTLANMEESMGFGLTKLQQQVEGKGITTMRALIYALLKEEQPELTLEGVGHLITLKEISLVSQTIAEIMAITK